MNFLSVLAVVLVGLTHYATAQWNNVTANCANGYAMQSGDTVYAIAGSNYYAACAWLNYNGISNPCTLQVGKCLYPPPAGTSAICTSCTGSCCPTASSGANTYGNYWNNLNGGYVNPPTYYSPSNTCASGQYLVQGGNTFYSLGGNTIGGMCAWRNANPGVDPCNLQIGQCLTQPTIYTSATCGSSYQTTSNSCGYQVTNTGSCGLYSGPIYSASTCSCTGNQYCIQSGDTFCRLAGYNTAAMCSWLNANPGVSTTNLQVGQCVTNPNTYATTSRNYNCNITC